MPTPTQLKRLGQEVQRLRKAAGLTQADLATKSSQTQPYISNIENANGGLDDGPMTPSDETLSKLADALNVEVGKFHTILGRHTQTETERIPADERAILAGYRNMPDEVKKAIGHLVAPYLPPESDEVPERDLDTE